MNGTKVELMEMLDARDNRYELQQKLLAEYQKPLISFTMNIAGPIKNNDLIKWAFDYGNEMLEGILDVHKIPVLHKEVISEVTGNEAFYVVGESGSQSIAQTVKKLAMQLEDECPIGRLFDIDILDPEGEHLDRVEMGGKIRTCLICEKPAKECGRSRAHTVEELQNKTEEILQNFQDKLFAAQIAELAVKSLLFEVGTTPKPGLVDLHDNGSHKDMDVFTFMASSTALYSYFEACVKEGILAKRKNKSARDLFKKLRFEGILAETKMKKSTGGVNTHKGAIFSLGILCGALGKLVRIRQLTTEATGSHTGKVRPGACPPVSSGDLQAEIKAMTKGLTEADNQLLEPPESTTLTALSDVTIKQEALTTGQKLYKQYGIRGARGEAEAGFPTVFETGLPTLEICLSKGMSLNEAGAQTLLAIMSATIDTNMIARSDYETALTMQKKIRNLRNSQGFWEKSTIEELNQEFISKNLSPGGSADLLAFTYFLHDLDYLHKI